MRPHDLPHSARGHGPGEHSTHHLSGPLAGEERLFATPRASIDRLRLRLLAPCGAPLHLPVRRGLA